VLSAGRFHHFFDLQQREVGWSVSA
jgi:hypothetical protein